MHQLHTNPPPCGIRCPSQICCDSFCNDGLPMKQHMSKGGSMALGVGSHCCQSSHMVMHLARKHNVAEVLLHCFTGFASAGTALPQPASGCIPHQLGCAKPPTQQEGRDTCKLQCARRHAQQALITCPTQVWFVQGNADPVKYYSTGNKSYTDSRADALVIQNKFSSVCI